MAHDNLAFEQQRLVFTELIASTAHHCESEIRQMAGMVKHQSKATRQNLLEQYGKEQAWRGLASDDFLRMVDCLVILEQEVAL